MTSSKTESDNEFRRLFSRWGVIVAVALYFFWAALLGPRSLGLEYDEALLQNGAVHMLNSPAEPTFAHDWGSWQRFAGRYWPLTVVPYAGAPKAYLALLPIALFGTDLLVLRLLSAVIAVFGIFGFATFIQRQVDPEVGAATAIVLSIHPAFVLFTLYDNNYFGFWMAALGAGCLALSWYMNRRTAIAALSFGFFVGIAVWGRVNFIWLLVAVAAAAILSFGRKLFVPWSHVAAVAIGGFIGSSPMLLYQYRSRLGILKFMASQKPDLELGSLLGRRLRYLAEVLIIGDENRMMWGHTTAPSVMRVLFATLMALALIQCLFFRDQGDQKLSAWKRTFALSFIFFTLLMLPSSLPVKGHHLISLIPFAAVAMGLALKSSSTKWQFGKYAAIGVATLFVFSATWWDVKAVAGIRSTHGVRSWSDAILNLRDELQTRYPDREMKILDWALQNNLYVLSNARIRSKEYFWGATREKTGFDRTWDDEITEGGVYVFNAAGNRHFPEATEGLLAALTKAQVTAQRTMIYQKNGAPFAEIVEIAPAPPPAK